MRYDSARLAGLPDAPGSARRPAFDGPFFVLSMLLLLAGVFAWSTVGTLETKAEVKIVVSDHTAQIIPLGSETLSDGMPLRVSGQEVRIASAQTDEYGRSIGAAEVNLPDGTYDGTIVTEAVHPISFLLESR